MSDVKLHEITMVRNLGIIMDSIFQFSVHIDKIFLDAKKTQDFVIISKRS